MSSDDSLDDPATDAAYAADTAHVASDTAPVADDSAPDVDFLDESAGYACHYVPDTDKSAAHDSADDKYDSAVKHTSVEHIADKHTAVGLTAVKHTAIDHTTAKHTVGYAFVSAANNNEF